MPPIIRITDASILCAALIRRAISRTAGWIGKNLCSGRMALRSRSLTRAAKGFLLILLLINSIFPSIHVFGIALIQRPHIVENLPHPCTEGDLRFPMKLFPRQ